MLTENKAMPYAALTPVPDGRCLWTGGLYQERFDTVAKDTIPHLFRMFEDGKISHVLDNFHIAAGDLAGEFHGTPFGDGDLYKWLEAATAAAVFRSDSEMLSGIDSVIELIARAQQADGYLSTKQIIAEHSGLERARQADINDFEVYNMGHLFTAACVHFRLTGKATLLHVAEAAAGYLRDLYARAAQSGEVRTAVCPSHYMGLIDLWRTTGKRTYLALAEQSIRLRDSVRGGLDDNQDRIPLHEQREIVGHAVRANYLYAGLTDLVMETGDPEDRKVLDAVWQDLVNTKLYLTGGCGALYNGASPYGNFFHHQLVHQAYGHAYQLPNVTAYNETCASVGGILWAWRMFLLQPEVQYIDVLERMLLNTCLASVSLDGKKFFYANMLRRAHTPPCSLVWGQERQPYISSFCCPPNAARLITESSSYAWAQDDEGVWAGLYGACRADFHLVSGARFTLEEETDYPWDGRIAFRIIRHNGIPFHLHLRIPAWAEGAEIRLGEKILHPAPDTYISLEIGPSDQAVSLDLNMQPRLTAAHPLVEADHGHAAMECGPLVYCVESADLPEQVSPADLLLPRDAHFSGEEMRLCGRKMVGWRTALLSRRTVRSAALYRTVEEEAPAPLTVRMIPYFAWDNRGAGEMAIWFPLNWN